MEIFNVYGIRPVSYKTSSLTKIKIARWNANQGYESFQEMTSERKDFRNLTLVGGITVGFLNFIFIFLFMFINCVSSFVVDRYLNFK